MLKGAWESQDGGTSGPPDDFPSPSPPIKTSRPDDPSPAAQLRVQSVPEP